jgi:hypothetical protein
MAPLSESEIVIEPTDLPGPFEVALAIFTVMVSARAGGVAAIDSNPAANNDFIK